MPSLYLHIPFCEKKCIYCDFYSIENLAPMETFLEALHREIDMYAGHAKGTRFETIFFGGGTPSLLTPQQLESILAHLYRSYVLTDDPEVTVETNPGTVTSDSLAAYRSLGVNRLSIGIQSFHDDELRFLGRIHDRTRAIRCVEYAYGAGFENVSVDLIYSLPGQTLARWQESLRTAVNLSPKHLSAYGLIVEDGTPLARMVRTRQISPNPPEMEASLYEFTMECMETHGFEHYEVSNYARRGYRSRHNYAYWCHDNYLGFGPSAHSFWKHQISQEGHRWWNISNVSNYCSRLKEGRLPRASEEILTRDELITERIFLGLRSDGLDIKRLESEFGLEFPSMHRTIINQLVADERVTLENETLLRLTSKGYPLCDEISERLML